MRRAVGDEVAHPLDYSDVASARGAAPYLESDALGFPSLRKIPARLKMVGDADDVVRLDLRAVHVLREPEPFRDYPAEVCGLSGGGERIDLQVDWRGLDAEAVREHERAVYL